MITYKESFRKAALKSRIKSRLEAVSEEVASQSPLDRKYEWFKRRYAKTN